MVIYCMSDIHGELDKFERMLDLIHFSDEDHLYILGDVIDRGALGGGHPPEDYGGIQYDHAPGQPRADVPEYSRNP